MNRRRMVFVGLVAVGAALGSVLAIAFFGLLRSRGVDPLFAFPLAAMAFFFAFILESLVLRRSDLPRLMHYPDGG